MVRCASCRPGPCGKALQLRAQQGSSTVNQPLSKRDYIFCSLFILLFLYLFRDILFGGHLLTGADFVSFYLGLKSFLFHEVHQHHAIPFWNPFVFGGIPFLAHFESTIFYPLDILFWFIPPEKAYGITMFIHFILASFFMYILVRSLGIGYAGSFAAATVYTLNGHILPVLNNGLMYRIQACTWMPLILFVLRKAVTSKSHCHYACLAGILWGVQILSGSPQDAFYTFLAGCFFLLCHARPGRLEMRHNLRILLIACLVFVTAVGLTAIQLVPAFEFINQSVRTLFNSFTLKSMGSYPLEGVITTLMPHFFGNFVDRSFWVSGTPWSVPVYNLYVGILPLLLFIYLPFRDLKNNRIFLFSVGLAILSLLLAFGANTPFYRLVSYLPGFDSIRAPAKTVGLWVLALGLLTGMAVDLFFKPSRAILLKRTRAVFLIVCGIMVLGIFLLLDRTLSLKVFAPFILDEAIPQRMADAAHIISGEFVRLMLLSALGLGFVLLYLRRILNRRVAAVLFCCLLLGDLLVVNRGAVPHKDELYQWAEQTKAALDNTIGRDKEIFRVGSYKFGMGASIEMYLGYQTVGGYNAMFLRRYYEYINQYRFYKQTIPLGWIIFFYGDHENRVLMDLLNVKYVISYANKSYGLRESYLPRAFFVPRAKVLPKKEILARLIDPDFDPLQTVLLEDSVPALPRRSQKSPLKKPFQGKVTITSYRPDEIVIRTDSQDSGYLFLSESFYPGWKAYVDETPVRILRGNYLFRVIELPRGKHHVRFVFDPFTIKLGMGITLLTMLIIVVSMSRRALKSKKSQR